MRQGCPLTISLFGAYIRDLDEVLKKAQAGGYRENMDFGVRR